MACGTVRAAEGSPAVAQEQVSAPVTITDNGPSWTLDNGIVKVTINKTSGNFRSLMYHGVETMSNGGSWEQNPSKADEVGGLSQSITIDPSKKQRRSR
ncbi:MAG TPA: hypothetical protein VHD56_17880 [Tepidisphaeraceae bacterium]|nr:hypothetical protein [Tepidisphaeraceae bacterium]